MTVRLLDDLRTLGIDRWRAARLFALTLLFAISEGVGLGMLIPIAAYASGLGRDGTGVVADLEDSLSRLLGTSQPDVVLAALLLIAQLPFGARVWLFYRREMELAQIKSEIGRNVRRQLIAAVMSASLEFLGRHSQGEVQALATVEADRAMEAVAGKVAFLTAAALSLTYFTLLAVLSPELSLYTLPVFAVAAVVLRRHGRRADRTSHRLAEQNTRLGRQLSDGIFGIERIKLRAREHQAVAELTDVTDRIAHNLKESDRLRALVQVRTEPILVLAVFVIVYLAIATAGMNFGMLGIYLLVIIRLVPQVLAMSQQWATMRTYNVSLEQLHAFLAEARGHRETATGTATFSELRSSIRLDGVEFRYTGDDARPPALNGLSCEIPARQTTAIVGRSGAGKTTLIRLLTGFYAPTKGDILFDAIPLPQLALGSLRRRIGVVPQKPFFFGTSLRENLTFGIEPAPLDKGIRDILGLCHCADFVDALPDGLETEVGSHGARLSEGQRQRLAIAHALLIEPTILIMDEPTAALDAESERAIQATLAALSGRLTVIVIAHRLSTIRHAEQILVLDRGRLAAQGTHTSLIRDSPLYRSLFQQSRS